MSQLFARVFVQILDSSIAEDFTLRHVFEDFLKICDHKTGVLDMTRQALSRRLNVPLDILNDAIAKLEQPDPNSRDDEFQGRRIEKLDDHRDWGWKILNWKKYDDIRTSADNYMRVIRSRDAAKLFPPSAFQKPTIEQLRLQCAKIGIPECEAERFFNHYESNGWKVGKNPMRSWIHAMNNWKQRFEERRFQSPGQRREPRIAV